MRSLVFSTAMVATLLLASVADASAPLSALVIKKADMPKGFVRVNAQTIQAPVSANWFPKAVDLRSRGYVVSYTAQFSDLGPHPKPHVVKGTLQEFADKYRDSSGAQWGYQGRVSARYSQAKHISLAPVGDESSAWHSILPEPPGVEIAIFFRQAGYVVELHCGGTLAKPATCLHYARTIDGRMRKKG